MHPNDGRVVSNFIIQALQGKPMTIYGEGEQTRSFQYVSDLVAGLVKLMNSDHDRPVNLGNPEEFKIGDFARKVRDMVNPAAEIRKLPATQDDPQRRRPSIELAKRVLGWEPRVPVDEGLAYTIQYFREELGLTEEPISAAAKEALDKYTQRDPPPTWVTRLVNDALTDKDKGLDVSVV
jgi:UDP-glucuronate decarboxylase